MDTADHRDPKRIKTESIDVEEAVKEGQEERNGKGEQVGDDEDLMVIDPPVVALEKDNHASANDLDSDDEVKVVGTLNHVDLPHMRCHCTQNPFHDMKDEVLSEAQVSCNRQACSLCYCYVCDIPIKDCPEWETAHCNAVDKGVSGPDWRAQREAWRRRKNNQQVVFQARLANGKILKYVFAQVCKLQKDTMFLECHKDGIELTCVCANDVVLCAFRLPAAAFDVFQCDKSLVVLDFMPAMMAHALKDIKKKSDAVTLKATGATLTVEVETGEPEPKLTELDVSDLSDAGDRMDIPFVDYKCLFQIPSVMFKNMIDAMTICGNVCSFSPGRLDAKTITVQTTCGGNGVPGCIMKAAYHVRPSHEVSKKKKIVVNCDIKPAQRFHCRYNLRYLRPMTGSPHVSRTVTVSLSPERPIEVKYDIGEEGGYFKFFVAPVLDEDDE